MRGFHRFAFASIAALVAASPASAQVAVPGNTSAVPTSPADATTPAGVNDDIVVTAQRRSESVLKVPLSVTVVSGDTLLQHSVNDLTSMTRLTPTLQVSQDNTFSVRGIGTATFSTTVESSVSQVVDDVVLGSNEFAANAFYDIARVEVLNGPQGLLFGKNASAGLVNITTVRPKLNTFSYDADLEVVNRDRSVSDGQGIQFRNTLNLPVGHNSALRLNLIYSKQDPVTYPQVNTAVRNDLGLRNFGARAKYLFEPSDSLSIYLIGDYNRQHGISGRYDVTFRQFAPGSAYVGLGLTAGRDNLIFSSDAPNFRDSTTGGAQASISYKTSSGLQLTNIAAWKTVDIDFQFDSDNTPINYFNYNNGRSNFNQYSDEFRVALPDGNRLTGQAGLYYYHSTNATSGFRGGANGLPSFVAVGFPFCVGATVLGAPPAACPVSNTSFFGQDYRFQLNQSSYAAFSQVGYQLTDALKLNLGGRLTYDKASIDLYENAGNYFVTLGVPRNNTNQSIDNTNFSFKLGLDWQLNPDTLVYGFYGRGYKGPGFSNTSPAAGANLAVRPEISHGGEIGLKGRAFDRRLTYSVSAFYTRFTDLQVQSLIQALRTFVLSNAATATTKGFEGSAQYRAARHLTVSASAAYTNAEFNDYPGAQCYPTQTSGGCNTAVPSTDPRFSGTFNAAGYQVPLSARFTGTIGAEYDPPLSPTLDGSFGASLYHRSPQAPGIGSAFLIPTWNTLDAHLGVKASNWSITIFCNNCTNSIRPITIGSDGTDANRLDGPPLLTLTQRFAYNSVRTVGARVGLSF